MATAQTQALREILDIAPNEPVEIALKYPTGKFVNGRNGERVMFTLADDRVMFLDKGPAQKINALGVKPREPFFVCVKWSGKRGDPKELVAWLSPEAEKTRALGDARAAGDSWTSNKLEQSIDRGRQLKAGEQANGTLVVPGAGREIIERAKETASRAAAAPPAPSPAAGPVNDVFQQRILGRANALADVYAHALHYAKRHDGNVSAEDVRWFVCAAFLGERGQL